MLKSLSYSHLLPDVFDLSSLAQALEEVVIPQIGRLAVSAFKAFDLSSLPKALDEGIATHASRLSVAVSDAFDLSPLSLALEDIITTEVSRPPAKAITDVFDLSSLSRALDECIPEFAQLQVKVKHELPNMNYHLHMTRTAPATTKFMDVVHNNITAAGISSTISALKAEHWRVVEALAKVVDLKSMPTSQAYHSAAHNTSVTAKHELPNMNFLHMTKTAPETTEFVNVVHNNSTAATGEISSTISARKAEKSRVVDDLTEVIDANPVSISDAAKSAALIKLPHIDITNLASSSKVVMEDLKRRTGIDRCSSTFSKSSKRIQAPSAIKQSNSLGHNPKNKSHPSQKSSVNNPLRVITGPPTSLFNVLTSSVTLISRAPVTLIVSKKRKYDVMVGTSDILVPNKKRKCSHMTTVESFETSRPPTMTSLPSRKRKLSDAFESFETGSPPMKHKIDPALKSPAEPEIVPTLPPVNRRCESKLISESSQSKALPPVDRRAESEPISESTWKKVPLPLHQHNESEQSKKLPQISHTKSVPSKKRSHDDAFESTEVFATKDPRKRRREADARPSDTAAPTSQPQSNHSDEPPVTLLQDIVINSRGNEQPTSRKDKRAGDTFRACCNEGDDLISFEESEAQVDHSAPHQPEDDRQTLITSLPVRKRTHRVADVFAEGQAEKDISVDEFIAECCGVIVEEPLERETMDLTNVEVEDGAEGIDDQMQEEVVEEGYAKTKQMGMGMKMKMKTRKKRGKHDIFSCAAKPLATGKTATRSTKRIPHTQRSCDKKWIDEICASAHTGEAVIDVFS